MAPKKTRRMEVDVLLTVYIHPPEDLADEFTDGELPDELERYVMEAVQDGNVLGSEIQDVRV